MTHRWITGVQPIAEWLVKIGLERYAPAFADNDIDLPGRALRTM